MSFMRFVKRFRPQGLETVSRNVNPELASDTRIDCIHGTSARLAIAEGLSDPGVIPLASHFNPAVETEIHFPTEMHGCT